MDYDAAYAMLRSLSQSTCKGNETGAVTWHYGKSRGVHNRLFQDEHQIAQASKENPLFTLKFKTNTLNGMKNHTCKLQTCGIFQNVISNL